MDLLDFAGPDGCKMNFLWISLRLCTPSFHSMLNAGPTQRSTNWDIVMKFASLDRFWWSTSGLVTTFFNFGVIFFLKRPNCGNAGPSQISTNWDILMGFASFDIFEYFTSGLVATFFNFGVIFFLNRPNRMGRWTALKHFQIEISSRCLHLLIDFEILHRG